MVFSQNYLSFSDHKNILLIFMYFCIAQKLVIFQGTEFLNIWNSHSASKVTFYVSAFCLRALCVLLTCFLSCFLSHQLLSLISLFSFFSFLSALLSMCTYRSHLCPLQSHFIVTDLLHLLGICRVANIPFVLQVGDRTYQLIWAQYQRTRRQMKK